jgi:hypothetical protein
MNGQYWIPSSTETRKKTKKKKQSVAIVNMGRMSRRRNQRVTVSFIRTLHICLTGQPMLTSSFGEQMLAAAVNPDPWWM